MTRCRVTRCLGKDNRQPAVSPGTRCRFHNNLDVAPKLGETVHQTTLGNTPKPAAQQVRQFGLRHVQQRRGLGLGNAFPFDDLGNLGHELCFDQHLVGIAVSEIGINVAGASTSAWRALRLLILQAPLDLPIMYGAVGRKKERPTSRVRFAPGRTTRQ
jgi:hypothetical protein